MNHDAAPAMFAKLGEHRSRRVRSEHDDATGCSQMFGRSHVAGLDHNTFGWWSARFVFG